MQSTDNEDSKILKAGRLKEIRKALGLSQEKMAEKLSTGQSHIGKYESGKLLIGKNVEYKILAEFNINPNWWNTGEGDIFNSKPVSDRVKMIENDSINYENLSFISIKSRVNFMESLSVAGEFETYQVSKLDPAESYAGQIVFEIEGNSMEPTLWEGCKIRCGEVSLDDWEFLVSGVYVVVYGNFLVVKRVKNSPVNGILTLHSDNVETGGTTEIPISKIRKIWRALRVVDAPIN